MYLDFTMTQAREHWPAWANFRSDEEYARWISLEAQSYRDASAIFTMSESTRKAVVRDYGVPAGKVLAVGSAAETEIRSPRDQTGVRLLFYTSAEFDRKGGDIAVDAFRLLREKIPSAELLIVGGGPEVEGPGITHVGYLKNRADIEDLVRTCDVVIAPSRCDPFTTFVVEAMTLGVPCVVSRTTGVAELIVHGESGIIVDPLSPENMFKELFSLLTAPEKAKHIAEGASNLVRDTLNWDVVGRKIAERLLQFASQGRPVMCPQTL
jgi:glycosyltransferase involved in cell wall biosynthesis